MDQTQGLPGGYLQLLEAMEGQIQRDRAQAEADGGRGRGRHTEVLQAEAGEDWVLNSKPLH